MADLERVDVVAGQVPLPRMPEDGVLFHVEHGPTQPRNRCGSSLRPADRAERAVPEWLAETEQQRAATGADLGVLIVRRWGTTDVGRWWCFLRLGVVGAVDDPAQWPQPVRLEVRHAVALIRLWGYGEPVELAS